MFVRVTEKQAANACRIPRFLARFLLWQYTLKTNRPLPAKPWLRGVDSLWFEQNFHGGGLVRRRTFWLSILFIIALVMIAAAYAGYRVNQLLSSHGISWQGSSMSWQGIQLRQLDIRQERFTVSAGTLHYSWRQPEHDEAQLSLHDVHLNLLPTTTAETETAETRLSDLFAQWQAIRQWLPKSITVEPFVVRLPCDQPRCTLTGSASLTHDEQNSNGRITLQQDAHSLAIDLLAMMEDTAALPNLKALAHLDAHEVLQLNGHLGQEGDRIRTVGDLQLSNLEQAEWFGQWLNQWLQQPWLDAFSPPPDAGLDARWDLTFPDNLQLHSSADITGSLQLDARLPQPWHIATLGQVQGSLNAGLDTTSGTWRARQLQADLLLHPTELQWPQALPAELRPQTIDLQAHSAHDEIQSVTVGEAQLPVQLQISTTGSADMQLSSYALLPQEAPWQLQLVDLEMTGHIARMKEPAWQATDVRIALKGEGRLNGSNAELTLHPGSFVDARELKLPEQTRLEQARIQTEHLAVQLHYEDVDQLHYQLGGSLSAQVRQLHQPQLKTHPWQFNGPVLITSANGIKLEGALHSDSGLDAQLELLWPPQQALQLKARLNEVFLRAGNPLAQTFTAWPTLLSFSQGRINADAQLHLPDQGALQVKATVSGKGLTGIYDRSELEGLDTDLNIQLNGQTVQVHATRLDLARLNPGIALERLNLRGQYKGRLNSLETGAVTLQQAQGQVFGGKLSLAPGSWTLTRDQQVLPVLLEGLDLSELLQAYPVEGLDGSGLIDVNLPLWISLDGAEVKAGILSAREPGGYLRFQSPRIRAMAQSNPSMKLVADALENFQYNLLDGTVDYNLQGKLQLGLRLHGQNPDVEGGRPIHFSINLEEDIPKLLASLQLSDKVSDIIQQRIQQRIR